MRRMPFFVCPSRTCWIRYPKVLCSITSESSRPNIQHEMCSRRSTIFVFFLCVVDKWRHPREALWCNNGSHRNTLYQRPHLTFRDCTHFDRIAIKVMTYLAWPKRKVSNQNAGATTWRMLMYGWNCGCNDLICNKMELIYRNDESNKRMNRFRRINRQNLIKWCDKIWPLNNWCSQMTHDFSLILLINISMSIEHFFRWRSIWHTVKSSVKQWTTMIELHNNQMPGHSQKSKAHAHTWQLYLKPFLCSVRSLLIWMLFARHECDDVIMIDDQNK